MKNVDTSKIPHLQELVAIGGEFKEENAIKDYNVMIERCEHSEKVLKTIREAVIKTELKDGMTISFHHHFRNGDFVVNMVMDVITEMGIKDLTLAASSLIDIHAPLIGTLKMA